MALTSVIFQTVHQWVQTHTITGYPTATVQGKQSGKVTPTVGTGAANRIYPIQGTLAAGATVTIDLSTLTEPTFGEAISPVRAYTVRITMTGSTWKFEPGAANPLTWFFSGTSPAIIGNAGDSWGFGSATAQTIDGTHKNVKITNTNGAALVLTYTVEWVLGV